MTALTALTAQNTLGVDEVWLPPASHVVAQVNACVNDIGVDVVKIGMIGAAETAHAVADVLSALDVPIVFDPVMVATSGATLADAETIAAFTRLMSIASLVTPNLPELEALGGREAVLAFGCHLLIKGGHGEGDHIIDELWSPSGMIHSIEGKRFDTTDTHGTGCTLASAIACRLGQRMGVKEAFIDGVRFVRIAILSAPGFGAGHGPMGHHDVRDFWDEDAMVPGVSLNQVTVAAGDYAASVAFYQALGLRQIVDAPENGYARFDVDNGATFSIHVGARVAGGTVVYFESVRLDAWVADLVRAGVKFDQMPRTEDWRWREARLRDPFGNIICLYSAGEMRRYPPWRV